MFSRVITAILIILSIILGILIAVAFSYGAMPYIRGLVKINVVLPVVLILIYVGIIALTIYMKYPHVNCAIIVPGITLLISSVGTLVTSIAALANNIVPATPGMRLLIGIDGAFFSLMILTFIYFVIRLAKKVAGWLKGYPKASVEEEA